MLNIGLIGGGFQHAYSTTLWKHPTHFIWGKEQIRDITFFIDQAIVDNINTPVKEKYGWVVESRVIIPDAIEGIKKHYKEISQAYKYVFAHYKELINLADNFIYLPPHGYWIEKPAIYPKTKLVSMISSDKRFGPGHNFRLAWADKLKNKLDFYGRGFNTFEKKEEAVCDYMFSVTIENDQYEAYWTEKILDCFVAGTVPIYHGSPNLGEFFNMDGIILLNDNFDLSLLSETLYKSMMPAIEDNFNRALKYDIIEDAIFLKYIQPGIALK